MAVSFEERIQRLLRPGASGVPLTGEAIEQAEKVLGVTLPSDLLDLLRHQNGGYVREEFAACPTTRPTNWADDYVAVNEIAGIGSAEVLSLLDTPYLNREWGHPPELVLLSGEGHWWIALDYRECGPAGEPTVVFYENESEGSRDELRLAANFREFVCILGQNVQRMCRSTRRRSRASGSTPTSLANKGSMYHPTRIRPETVAASHERRIASRPATRRGRQPLQATLLSQRSGLARLHDRSAGVEATPA